MDIGLAMSPEVFEDKLEHAHDGKSPEATWNTKRLPKVLTPGWTNRLFVAVGGTWRGYFPLSGDVLWNPEDADAPYALIFDTRGWTPIPPSPAARFRSWTYFVPRTDGGPDVIEFEKIWTEQCGAAREIRAQYGSAKALGYLIGEKLMNFVEAAKTRPEFARELPAFIGEIKSVFDVSELRDYLENVKRIGALGHVLGDKEFQKFLAAGAVLEDAVGGAEDVLRLDRIKELLLDKQRS